MISIQSRLCNHYITISRYFFARSETLTDTRGGISADIVFYFVFSRIDESRRRREMWSESADIKRLRWSSPHWNTNDVSKLASVMNYVGQWAITFTTFHGNLAQNIHTDPDPSYSTGSDASCWLEFRYRLQCFAGCWAVRSQIEKPSEIWQEIGSYIIKLLEIIQITNQSV